MDALEQWEAAIAPRTLRDVMMSYVWSRPYSRIAADRGGADQYDVPDKRRDAAVAARPYVKSAVLADAPRDDPEAVERYAQAVRDEDGRRKLAICDQLTDAATPPKGA